MATYTVTNTNDSGADSLRQAILDANANAGADSITFAGSIFTDSTPDTITLTGGQLLVTDSVTITGTGANLLTINGNNTSRVFQFGGGGSNTYTLSGVTITGGNGVGNSNGFGGGILMGDEDDTLNIDRTVITGNTASIGSSTGGGLLLAFGTLNLTNSTVSNNTAGFGGGIELQNVNASLSNVTVSGNSAVNNGGGIIHVAGGTGATSSLSLTNVTIANNSAGFGSGLLNGSQLDAVSAVTRYSNSIFANNTGLANILNVGSTGTVVQSLGYNISSDGSGNLTATGDLSNTNPLLGSLQNNGGSTPTHALLPGSPAIGAGNTALTTDQRGITRPQGTNDDIGAFELENATPTNLVLNPSSISENSPINTVVGSFVTTDPNGTDIYTYTFVGGASYPDNSLFTIDGSQLKANFAFDFESDNSYTIKVKTSDQDGLFYEKELTINVTNVNETPTNLALNNTSVAENSSLDTVVGNFSTTDPDVGDTFTYSLVDAANFPDNAAFTITGNQLKVKAAFDFETDKSYSIKVRTTDQGGLFYEKALTIGITNVNEAPTAVNDSISAYKNTPTTIAASTLLANDTDPDAGTTLKITSVSNAINGTVSLNSSGDVVFTASKTGNASFQYTTSDGSLTSTASVAVSVGLNLNGGNGIDVLLGSDYDDLLNGNDRADVLYGNKGNDILNGGKGIDLLLGGAGNDTLTGGAGNDTIAGGAGQDKFIFATGDGIDTITDFGGYGTSVNPNSAVLAQLDTLQFIGTDLTAKNLLLTQNGNNLEVTFDNVANTKVILQNFPQEKFANGPSGNSVVGNIQFDGQTNVTDSIDVFDNNENPASIFNQNTVTFLNDLNNNVKGFDNSDDVINGQGGNDTIDALSGNDYLRGGAGNDTLTGGTGNDTLAGGAGQDKFIFRPGDGIDTITDFGGYGTSVNPNSAVLAQLDTLQFIGTDLTAKNLLLTQNGNNLEVTFDNVANTKVILQNFPQEKFANGPSGNSVVGNIQFNGQTNVTDSIDVFDNNENPASLFHQNTVTFLNNLNNNVKGFDNSDDVINGQGGDDTIDGLSGNDYLRGGAGNDIVLGGAGNDVLAGDAGNDVLTGGNNADSFVFNTNATFTNSAVGIDKITDFTPSQGDKIVLDKTTFSQITSAAGNGFSNAADFVVVNSPQIQQGITSAAIVYDAASGGLFYNENGSASGFGNGGQFATLAGLPTLSASDFIIQA